jgi:hypothetical protein
MDKGNHQLVEEKCIIDNNKVLNGSQVGEEKSEGE